MNGEAQGVSESNNRIWLMRRLLELAQESEQKRDRAKIAHQVVASRRYEGEARAYYHAARLAGWQPESQSTTAEEES